MTKYDILVKELQTLVKEEKLEESLIQSCIDKAEKDGTDKEKTTEEQFIDAFTQN